MVQEIWFGITDAKGNRTAGLLESYNTPVLRNAMGSTFTTPAINLSLSDIEDGTLVFWTGELETLPLSGMIGMRMYGPRWQPRFFAVLAHKSCPQNFWLLYYPDSTPSSPLRGHLPLRAVCNIKRTATPLNERDPDSHDFTYIRIMLDNSVQYTGMGTSAMQYTGLALDWATAATGLPTELTVRYLWYLNFLWCVYTLLVHLHFVIVFYYHAVLGNIDFAESVALGFTQ